MTKKSRDLSTRLLLLRQLAAMVETQGEYIRGLMLVEDNRADEDTELGEMLEKTVSLFKAASSQTNQIADVLEYR